MTRTKHAKQIPASFFGRILAESNLDGVKYIGSSELRVIERIFWVVIVSLALLATYYIIVHEFQKYMSNALIISFKPMESHISYIPFPAITICNINIIKMHEINSVYDHVMQHYLKPNYDKKIFEKEVVFLDYLTHFCMTSSSFRRILGEKLEDAGQREDFLNRLYSGLVRLNDSVTASHEELQDKYWNATKSFHNIASHRCEDMILKCMWAQNLVPCEDLFSTINTQNGQCCVFNMMPKHILRKYKTREATSHLPDDAVEEWSRFQMHEFFRTREDLLEAHYPKHQTAGGQRYGLEILVNPEMALYSTCTSSDGWGLKMVAHSPISFPRMDSVIGVPPSSEVFIDIIPEATIADDDMLGNLPINRRGCYLPTDKESILEHYNHYSVSNCMDECIAKATYENCSCVQYSMPRNSAQKLCGAKKRECSEAVWANLTMTRKFGRCSKCLPSCTEITYKLQSTLIPLGKHASLPLFYNSSESLNKSASNYSILHIYFGTNSLYINQRIGLYDLFTLISNIGGAFGLTIGFSIMSLVELMYFFTFRAWFHFWKWCQTKLATKRAIALQQ